jgi:hypothetical protein
LFAHERSLVDKYRNRPFALIGVNEDDELKTLQRAQEKEHLNWRSFWDGGGGPISLLWKTKGLPSFFLIDRKGMVRWQHLGVPDLKRLEDLIEQLLKEAEKDGGKQTALNRQ